MNHYSNVQLMARCENTDGQLSYIDFSKYYPKYEGKKLFRENN